MMKKGALFVVIIVIGALFFFSQKNKSAPKKNATENGDAPTAGLQITKSPPQDTATSFPTSNGYKVNWIVLRDFGKLALYSNLSEKSSSLEAATKNSCQSLINGGFWKENALIGLFIADGQKLEEDVVSPLFNGYFSITFSGKAEISQLVPKDSIIALQSGPILLKQGKSLPLRLENDEEARRIVVALNKDKQILFVVVYQQGNPILGPKLEELPAIIESVSKDKNLQIKDALNLDGGTHSAFLSDAVKLTELLPIGSFFCIKP